MKDKKAKKKAAAESHESLIQDALQEISEVVVVEEPLEAIALSENLHERISELKYKIKPIEDLISKSCSLPTSDDDLGHYLETKQQILLCYLINLVYYAKLKTEYASVNSHPVMNQLLELRYLMEKMRPLDGKLKYQIDHLLSLAHPSSVECNNESNTVSVNGGASLLKPNLSDLMSDDDNDSGDDKGNRQQAWGADFSGRKSGQEKSSGVYRAPRLQAVPYNENEDDRNSKKMLLKKKKLKNSEMLETLHEEFGHNPESISSSGVSKNNEIQRVLREEAEERRRFEEDRFVRLTMSRQDKKSIKKRQRESEREDMMMNIGDAGDFENIVELTKKLDNKNEKYNSQTSKQRSGNNSERNKFDSVASMKKAVSALMPRKS